MMKKAILILLAVFLVFPIAIAQESRNIDLAYTEYCFWAYPTDVEMVGNYAFIATGYSGLSINDISNPTSPQSISAVDIPSRAMRVRVQGNYAYIITENSGLQIVDISDITTPVIVGSFDTEGICRNLDINGDILCFTDSESGVYIIDVSDPGDPAQINLITFEEYPRDVVLRDDLAFVTTDDTGLLIFDISDPQSISQISSLEIPGYNTQIKLSGNFAYINHYYSGDFDIINISDPQNPVHVGSYETNGNFIDMHMVGTTAYVVDHGMYDLLVFDFSDPASPSEIASLHGFEWPAAIAVSGNYAVIADEIPGYRIVDISNIENMEIIASEDRYQKVRNVCSNDEYVYLSIAAEGLRVYDASEPYDAVEIGYCESDGRTDYSAYYDDIVYATCRSYGMKIYDVSIPTRPQLVTMFDPDLILGNFVKNGDYIYCSYFDYEDSGILVIDVSDPANSEEIYQLITGSSGSSIQLQNDVLWLSQGNSGLAVIDISDPTSPEELTRYNFDEGLYNFCIDANTAYLAYDGLRIYDISNPASMQLIAMHDIEVGKLFVDGNYLYSGSGFSIYNIEDLENPVEVGSFNTPGDLRDYSVNGEFTYVADNYHFEILDCSVALDVEELDYSIVPVDFSVGKAYPNPFNPSFTVPFNLDKPGNVSLAIYNLLGQKVYSRNKMFNPGQNTIQYIPESLKNMSSGTYVIRLQLDENVEVQKVQLIK